LPPLILGHSICAMKADDGPCKAIHIRYFFNIQSRECEIFEYGGCHGNENNFLTLEECQKNSIAVWKCVLKFSFPHLVHHLLLFVEKPDFCFHEKDPGVCRGYFTRYFYNKETESCEAFKYGGCLGNQNNFKSLEECQSTCQENFPLQKKARVGSKLTADFFHRGVENIVSTLAISREPPPIPSLCMTPMDRGVCRAKELRFFYNYSTGRCRPFSYSGCGGNENNFTSKKSCLRICKK
ncbi:TFPI1 inhibitor, partial [Sakesphorus luctuosus]|nr:TFPI1 inhibitor [Sakesphorus luctuosus]